MSSRIHFDDAIRGMLESIRFAADPYFNKWDPYVGDRIGRAVWQTRDVVRKARGLGLWRDEVCASGHLGDAVDTGEGFRHELTTREEEVFVRR